MGGAGSVVAYTYNSSTARIEQHSATEAFFAAIGSAEVEHTICAHTVGEAWASVFGSMGSADPADVVHSDLVVLWGANPNASNVHVAELLRKAQRSGTRIVVIDPPSYLGNCGAEFILSSLSTFNFLVKFTLPSFRRVQVINFALQEFIDRFTARRFSF